MTDPLAETVERRHVRKLIESTEEPMEPITDDEAQRWQAEHVPAGRFDEHDPLWCKAVSPAGVACQEDWPCPTIRLLDERERLREERERRENAGHALAESLEEGVGIVKEQQATIATLEAEVSRLREAGEKAWAKVEHAEDAVKPWCALNELELLCAALVPQEATR